MRKPFKIIDCHMHLYDHKANKHSFLDEVDHNYEAFVGDYSTMPRQYLLENYLKDTAQFQVEGIVWHEFLSTDPIKETKWAEDLASKASCPVAMVTMVDFLDPELEKKLEFYQTVSHIKGVREHMLWDDNDTKKRFAKRPDLLSDEKWQKQMALLNRYNFKCSIEIFAPQLPQLIKVIQRYPDIGFTVAVMGWPLDVSQMGQHHWRQDMQKLSQCKNVRIGISALECIFGMNWEPTQVAPWILATLELFGTNRCMFGSHLPIVKLSRSCNTLYDAYDTITANFSETEKENLFHKVAAEWYEI